MADECLYAIGSGVPTANVISHTFGPWTTRKHIVECWLKKFRYGNKSLGNEDVLGRESVIDSAKWKALVKAHLPITHPEYVFKITSSYLKSDSDAFFILMVLLKGLKPSCVVVSACDCYTTTPGWESSRSLSYIQGQQNEDQDYMWVPR